MKVPFLDLKRGFEAHAEAFDAALAEVAASGYYILGPHVKALEAAVADYLDVPHTLSCASGTDALHLAVAAAGIGPGDEVITVPNTFIATAEAITFCGATPVFVDIDDKTYTMDPQKLEDYLKACKFNKSTKQLINQSTKRPVRAIIPVHIFGQIADMDPLLEIANNHGLFVVEDACQAHGAEYKGREYET